MTLLKREGNHCASGAPWQNKALFGRHGKTWRYLGAMENKALLGRHGKTRRFESVAENHGGTAEEKTESAMENRDGSAMENHGDSVMISLKAS